MGNLKKNFVYAFGAQGLQLLQSVLWSLLIPKLLGVEEFGYWQLFIFYTQYGGFIHFGLIDGIYLREGGKEYAKLDFPFLGYQLRMFMVWQLLALLPFIYLGIINDTPARAYVIIASCLFVFLSNVSGYLMYILQAVNEIKAVAFGRVVMTMAFILCTIFLIGFRITRFEPYIVSYIFSNFLCELYYIAKSKDIFKRLFASSLPWYFQGMLGNMKLGIVLLLANICGMLILGYGRFLVDHAWGIKAFSIVSFAFMFVNFFMTFVMQASLVLFPELRRWSEDKVNTFYMEKRRILSLYSPLVLLLYMPIYYFVQFWLPQYLESVKYLLFLMPLCIFDTKMNLFCNTLFKVFSHVRQLLFCNIVALACSICLISLSIYWIVSIKAVVISMLLAIAVRSIVAEVLLAKDLGSKDVWKYIVPELLLIALFILLNNFLSIWMAFIAYCIIILFRFLLDKNFKYKSI